MNRQFRNEISNSLDRPRGQFAMNCATDRAILQIFLSVESQKKQIKFSTNSKRPYAPIMVMQLRLCFVNLLFWTDCKILN